MASDLSLHIIELALDADLANGMVVLCTEAMDGSHSQEQSTNRYLLKLDQALLCDA